MLVYAAIVPHSPILIPEIGREHAKKLKKTSAALEIVRKELVAARPQTIVILSPHGAIIPDAFSANLFDSYRLSLQEFGNFQIATSFRTDARTLDHLQRHLRGRIPFVLHSVESLDYGTAVPLILLAPKDVRIVPMHTSLLDTKAHYQFGDLLKNEIMESNRRVAVLASADLAYTPKDKSTPLSKKVLKLDEYLCACIESRNAPGLLQVEPSVIKASKMCGWGPLVALHGLLERVNTFPKVLSYESVLGVGYVTASFPL